jgi:hypothetical protein
MTIGYSHRLRWFGVALAALAVTLLPACDPPKDVPSGASADAGAAAQSAETDADENSNHGRALKFLPVSGDVVLLGGWSSGNKSTAAAEFFDPTTKKFKKLGSMAVSASALTAALLTGSTTEILAAGGFGGKSNFTHRTVSNTITGTATNNLQTLDLTIGEFTATSAPLLDARFGASATKLPSGNILIAGGSDSAGTPTNTAEIFDPVAGTTALTTNAMSIARLFHTATLLNDGTVLIAGGGTDDLGDLTETADIYDPGTNSVTATLGPMEVPRAAHAATLLTIGFPGQVLITGGLNGGSTGFQASPDAELYDPVAKTFSGVPAMIDQRAFHTASLLGDGNVLIVGGFARFFANVNGSTGSLNSLFGSSMSSAEIYDPLANAFTCVTGTGPGGGFNCSAAMKMALGGHTATVFTAGPLAGQVLIAGGLGAKKPNSKSSELSEAELFDPNTETFTNKKVGKMTSKRGLHAALLLP